MRRTTGAPKTPAVEADRIGLRRMVPRFAQRLRPAVAFGALTSSWACGGGPPPDPAMRPAGSGWYCWQEQGGREADCRRTANDCNANRDRRLRLRGGLTFSGCEAAPDARVHCFSFVEKEFERTDYRCAPHRGQCSDLADLTRGDLRITQVSGCAAWE